MKKLSSLKFYINGKEVSAERYHTSIIEGNCGYYVIVSEGEPESFVTTITKSNNK